MQLEVVIVSPKYQNNLGYIARVAANFGIKQLRFVSPRAKLAGKNAIMYAKHARHLLEHPKIYPDFKKAIKDCDIVVGTTGVALKGRSDFRKLYFPNQMLNRLNKISSKNTKVALCIGRDDTGLSKGEMEECDLMVFVPTDPKYPVLNISHALGIMLFVLTQNGLEKKHMFDDSQAVAQKSEINALYKAFARLIENKRIRNKKTVESSFRRLVALSQPTRREVHALLTALKK